MVLVAVGVTGDPVALGDTDVEATEVGVCEEVLVAPTDCELIESPAIDQASVADAPETTTDESLGIPVNGILKTIVLLPDSAVIVTNTPPAVAYMLGTFKLLAAKIKRFVHTLDRSLAERQVTHTRGRSPVTT